MTMTTNRITDDQKQSFGLECLTCGCRHFRVGWTRQQDKRIMRVRFCRHCGRRLVTYEKPAGSD